MTFCELSQEQFASAVHWVWLNSSYHRPFFLPSCEKSLNGCYCICKKNQDLQIAFRTFFDQFVCNVISFNQRLKIPCKHKRYTNPKRSSHKGAPKVVLRCLLMDSSGTSEDSLYPYYAQVYSKKSQMALRKLRMAALGTTNARNASASNRSWSGIHFSVVKWHLARSLRT